jgi:hypothetical protein
MTGTNGRNFTISLRPHVGEATSMFGKREVRHPQDIVIYRSEELRETRGNPEIEIGMAGHNTGTIEFAPYAHQLSPEDIQFVCDEVGRLTGRPRRANLPSMALPSVRTDGGYMPDLDQLAAEPAAIPDLDGPQPAPIPA